MGGYRVQDNSNSIRPHILLVEDSKSTALVYRSYLAADFQVSLAHSLADASRLQAESRFELLLVDVRLPDGSGLDILRELRLEDSLTPVVLMTAHGSVDIAVDAMRLGASDFLTKPFERARLLVTLQNALKGRRLTQIVDEYEKSCTRDHFHGMVGACLPMQSVYRIIESAAGSRATVFISGESGTGKELCAEALHAQSKRAAKPYVALNCAAIPHDLLESEIFGHVKGAFTGANAAREGAAARAAGGTLFLDEIGEMPLDLQSKLLRFIQSGAFTPVGGNTEIQTDLRFVCATNRDPLEEVRAGRFREDLYYRLHVIPVQMPALRDRGHDCLLIARAMLKEYSADEQRDFIGFTPDVEAIFQSYDWPGNVRELSNVIRNIVVLNDAQWVEPQMLPTPLDGVVASDMQVFAAHSDTATPVSDSGEEQAAPEATAGHSQHSIEPLWLSEKRIIEHAISHCQGNVPRAAAFLEISPSTIYRKKQQWGRQEAESLELNA
ncbi:sigma-54-dependent Fis family transcriptional regulator [Marinobacterium rhizophilum]|uniref:Sigma-54-dependent Fis family transcriptional regulator n=2 Tax=Marinobacterium rhizophilum TaxID=420402 RepID=A0ABY5HRS3_9GAMM|nr:sigma-54-dependent Fis family transcriptional regulator [Marinobacterium rhizophilum]